MAESEKSPADILAELERQVEARKAEVLGSDPETARKIEEAKADLEYLDLVQRFSKLGKQGQKFAIVDVSAHGKGFIVLVTGPKAELHHKTLAHLVKEDSVTPEQVLAIVREYVKHPSVEAFDAIVAETPSVVDVCLAAIHDLWGARAKIRQEK